MKKEDPLHDFIKQKVQRDMKRNKNKERDIDITGGSTKNKNTTSRKPRETKAQRDAKEKEKLKEALETLAKGEFTSDEVKSMLQLKDIETKKKGRLKKGEVRGTVIVDRLQEFIKKEYNIDSYEDFKQFARKELRIAIINKMTEMGLDDGNERILIFLAETYLNIEKKEQDERPQQIIFQIEPASKRHEVIEVDSIEITEQEKRAKDTFTQSLTTIEERIVSDTNRDVRAGRPKKKK